MPIHLFLEHDHSFGPEDIAKMSAAFEAALGKLGLVDRSDPAMHEVAKLIIEFAKQGQRDPKRLCALALQRLPNKPRPTILMSTPASESPRWCGTQLRNSDNGSHVYTMARNGRRRTLAPTHAPTRRHS